MTRRYSPDRSLPQEPYLPGIGQRPPESDLHAPMLSPDRWMGNDAYLWGVDLFNAGYYWEAHEAWEAAWHAAPGDTQKSFLQALVQYAAGMLKFRSGPKKTAAVLAERSLARLEGVKAQVEQPPYMGCDLDSVIAVLRRMYDGEVLETADAQLVLSMRSRDYLGAVTDRWTQPACTRYLEREGYLVADTPEFRAYYNGHYLLLDRAPEPTQLEMWFKRWEDDRGALPGTSRYLVWEDEPEVTWDAPDLGEGTVYQRIPTMARKGAIDRAPPPDGIVLKRISNDDDWAKLVGFGSELYVPEHGDVYREFARWRYDQYRQSLRRSGGSWWAAFAGDELVGSLGLFESPGLLRFQEVQVAESQRKRGIATALLSRALASAHVRFKKATAIICPEEASGAERIYERLGFRTVSVGHWVMRSAKTE